MIEKNVRKSNRKINVLEIIIRSIIGSFCFWFLYLLVPIDEDLPIFNKLSILIWYSLISSILAVILFKIVGLFTKRVSRLGRRLGRTREDILHTCIAILISSIITALGITILIYNMIENLVWFILIYLGLTLLVHLISYGLGTLLQKSPIYEYTFLILFGVLMAIALFSLLWTQIQSDAINLLINMDSMNSGGENN